jgi:hypothetical protein
MKNHFFNTNNIHSVDFIKGRQGQFRAIVKVKAGFMTVVDDLGIQSKWESGAQWKSIISVFRGFKKGALQTIEFKAEGSDHWLTVFARSGNKVKLMDEELFMTMQVGDINQSWYNTNLYNQTNYTLAGAKTWADLAFALNESKEAVAA